RQLDLLQLSQRHTEEELAALASRRQELERNRSDLERAKSGKSQEVRQVVLSLADLQKRRERLNQELKELEKLPPLTKTLRYRTPVSQTVHASESHFECKQGKVTFVDLETMLQIIQRGLREKEKLLQSQWHVVDETEPVGAFRMRYVIERRRSNLDALGGA